ncbi:uncharacterized protein [Rutidosis leptorrhynchoides]|uniref:uncharacterized protein n=1 Tax=Rutidosis leptorrhynchoides TaxID=125765 RepID=UPI003A99C089
MFRELMFNVSKFALKEIYKQYLLLKKGTKTSCTSHFTKTMGLPCAHVIESLQGTTLSLELVHPHWRIDTLSLNPDELSQNDGCESFVNLVNELVSKYKVWPEYKKEYATLMLGKLVNEHDILFDPMIQRSKGRPPKSKRKKGVTSTAREPSKFELVESSRSHNPSSVGTSQWSGEVEDTSYINFESTLMDLNGYPEFSEDYMLFD